MAGIISTNGDSNTLYTGTREKEKESSTTIRSTAVSMYFQVDEEDIQSIKQKNEGV
jgi:elongation factor 2